ncbi:hypothetical protein ACSAZL_13260 [Methanosarcina sp. T3]|uniref:hypothetical protein n=1 Tax=Methanosarcina sp. T3 TaxID=3439062 RepID=UPI003F859A96
MTDPKIQNQYYGSSFKFLSVKKKTIIRIYLLIGWVMVAFTLMTAVEVVSYDDIKYFFWMVPVSTAVLYLLYVNGKPHQVPKDEEIKSIFALIFTFLSLLMAFFAAVLMEY